jgi:hypothetical protein
LYRIDRGDIHTLDVGTCERLMRYVETFNGGELVPYFAYFNRVSKADAQRFWQIAPAEKPANIIPMALAFEPPLNALAELSETPAAPASARPWALVGPRASG